MGHDEFNDPEKNPSSSFLGVLDHLTRHPVFGVVSVVVSLVAFFTEELPLHFRIGFVAGAVIILAWTALPKRLRNPLTTAAHGILRYVFSTLGFAVLMVCILVIVYPMLDWITGGWFSEYKESRLDSLVMSGVLGIIVGAIMGLIVAVAKAYNVFPKIFDSWLD